MFNQKRDVLKVDGFGPFLGPIYPQKTQNIAKNQNFFQKLYPYDYQITQVPDPGINHRILIKLIKKPIVWAKYGLFKVKNRPVNKDQEVRDQVSTTFMEAPN